jgi:hypothetical protein
MLFVINGPRCLCVWTYLHDDDDVPIVGDVPRPPTDDGAGDTVSGLISPPSILALHPVK